MQHATCDMRHATCNMQHATCNMQGWDQNVLLLAVNHITKTVRPSEEDGKRLAATMQ